MFKVNNKYTRMKSLTSLLWCFNFDFELENVSCVIEKGHAFLNIPRNILPFPLMNTLQNAAFLPHLPPFKT